MLVQLSSAGSLRKIYVCNRDNFSEYSQGRCDIKLPIFLIFDNSLQVSRLIVSQGPVN